MAVDDKPVPEMLVADDGAVVVAADEPGPRLIVEESAIDEDVDRAGWRIKRVRRGREVGGAREALALVLVLAGERALQHAQQAPLPAA